MSINPGHSTRRMAAVVDEPYRPPSPWRKLVGWNAIGVGILIAAFAVSLVSLLSLRGDRYAATGNKKIVRLLHWQLEPGFRQAVQHMIDDYNALKAREYAEHKIPAPIEVVQMGVTEKVYEQFVNTNLIAGTAPDLIEMGRGRGDGPYKAQYFLPYAGVLEKPNPYNAPQWLHDPALPADLRAALPYLPWRETFIGGMRSGWDEKFQAYYAVPTTSVTANRLCYNVDLLRAATGSAQPPRTLGELLAVCRAITAYGKREGRDLIPIAGNRYATSFWRPYAGSFTAQEQDTLDVDLNGEVSDMEGWAALGAGRISFADPAYRDFATATSAISANFSPGFVSMERDTSTFLFLQQKAVMIFAGSWDAGTLIRQVPFHLEVVHMPLPALGEPMGDPLKSPISEVSGQGTAGFGIPKSSRVVPEAIDFLQYWTSHDVNQRVNADSDWLPTVLGCAPSTIMAPFAPLTEGVSPTSGWAPDKEGQQVTTFFEGQMLKLLSGEITYDELVRGMDGMFAADAYGWKAIWAKAHDNAKINLRQNQRSLAGRLLHDHLLPAQGDPKARLTMAAWATNFNGEDRRLLFNRTMGESGKRFPEVDR